jgi:hypothetical protein
MRALKFVELRERINAASYFDSPSTSSPVRPVRVPQYSLLLDDGSTGQFAIRKAFFILLFKSILERAV